MVRAGRALGLAAIIAAMPAAAYGQRTEQAPEPTVNQTADSNQQLEPTTGLTGDWGGLRTRLRDRGIDITFSALSELGGNVSGGERHDVTQVSGFALGLALDTEKLFGLKGGSFQAIGTKRQGPALLNRAGLNTLQPPQEIYARGQTYRLSDFYYLQQIGRITELKIGRMTMGEDFAVLPCDFMNLTFCGNPVGNIVGNYWYNGPISQWAARVRVKPGAFKFMLGVYEYNPNNLKEDVALNHGGARGVTVLVEAGWMPRLGPRKLPGSYRVGFWYNTDHAQDLLIGTDGRPFAVSGLDPLERQGRYGGYVELQQQLTGSFVEDGANGPKTTHGLSVFFNFTQTDRRTTRTDSQAALWLVFAGPLKARPFDDAGIGIGRTHVNTRAALAETLAAPGSDRPGPEYSSEIYYGVHVRPGLVFRPNVQFIMRPGGYGDARGIVVFGLKSAATF